MIRRPPRPPLFPYTPLFRSQAGRLLREDPDHLGLEVRQLLLTHQRLVELQGQALQERGLADDLQLDQDPAEPLRALALPLEGGRELLLRQQTAPDQQLPEELPLALALASAGQWDDTWRVPVFWGHAFSPGDHRS